MIIGKDLHVEYSEYKGRPQVVIRRYYEEGGVLKPGKAGINLKLEEWQEFLANLEKIKEEIDKKTIIDESVK